jgi:hypothetical protein
MYNLVICLGVFSTFYKFWKKVWHFQFFLILCWISTKNFVVHLHFLFDLITFFHFFSTVYVWFGNLFRCIFHFLRVLEKKLGIFIIFVNFFNFLLWFVTPYLACPAPNITCACVCCAVCS